MAGMVPFDTDTIVAPLNVTCGPRDSTADGLANWPEGSLNMLYIMTMVSASFSLAGSLFIIVTAPPSHATITSPLRHPSVQSRPNLR
jgi:hypothetical protein